MLFRSEGLSASDTHRSASPSIPPTTQTPTLAATSTPNATGNSGAIGIGPGGLNHHHARAHRDPDEAGQIGGRRHGDPAGRADVPGGLEDGIVPGGPGDIGAHGVLGRDRLARAPGQDDDLGLGGLRRTRVHRDRGGGAQFAGDRQQ